MESSVTSSIPNYKQCCKSLSNTNCVKNVHIRNYSGPYFPAFGLNTERYFASLRIQFECGKIQTRTTPNMDTFYAVCISPFQICIGIFYATTTGS